MAVEKKKREVRARKWRLGDARVALRDPMNAKDRQDIARRFPLYATATDDQLFEALNLLKYLTVRKLEKALKLLIIGDEDLEIDEDILDEDEDEDEEDEDEDDDEPVAPAKPKVTAAKPDPGAKPTGVKRPLKTNGLASIAATLAPK